jgi:hypothetical protein
MILLRRQNSKGPRPHHLTTTSSSAKKPPFFQFVAQNLQREEVHPLSTTRLSPTTFPLSAQRTFSSLTTLFTRSTARTATLNQSLLSCTVLFTSTTNFSTSRIQARKMGPKKAVKEEKILLGRPGNSLKSGIVCS